jgi:phosphate starvation-inducible PhoH-like protein
MMPPIQGFYMSFCGTEIIRDRHDRPIYTKTEGQQRLVDAINSNDIIFVNGPSGTGKTAIATWVGIAGLDDGAYERLVLTRPVVTGGEELGFLPGSLDEKIAPYMQPLYDAISLIKGRREKPEDTIKKMPVLTDKEKRSKKKSKKNVEESFSNNDFYSRVQVCPLAYIRGSTLSKSFIVCDEFQNTTIAQMKMMLTRLGKDSKMIICGDSNQTDLPPKVTSGFMHAQNLLRGVPRIGYVTLGIDDIVRHRLIKEIILRYEVPGYKPNTSIHEDDFSKVPSHTWERDREGYDFEPTDDDEEDELCKACGGTGVDDDGEVCKYCKGTGLEPIEQ